MVTALQGFAVTNLIRGENSFAQSFVQTSQLSAGPNFELQFFNTQNAVLDQLNEQVTEIQNGINTDGATALLKVKIAQLETSGERITDYKNTTDIKAKKIDAAIEYIVELEALATAGDSSAFEERLALLHKTLEKTPSPTYESFGTNDRFRKTKFESLTAIEGFNTNGFSTQQNIDDARAMLTEMKQKLNVSKSLVGINADIAFTKQTSNQSRILEVRSGIFKIETAAQTAATRDINEKQELYSQILTVISLAFDASQEFTNYISQTINFEQKTPAGSIMNLFS